jgi:hypothetical protein
MSTLARDELEERVRDFCLAGFSDYRRSRSAFVRQSPNVVHEASQQQVLRA